MLPSGIGIVRKNANFCDSETDSAEKKIVLREKKSVVRKKKKKGSTSFSSAPNTRETYGMRSHAAIARLGHVIVNTVTCYYSRRLATGMNAGILTCFCAMFRLRKSECYESFESNFFGGGGAGF